MALSYKAWKEARETLQDLLSLNNPILQNNADLRARYVQFIKYKLCFRLFFLELFVHKKRPQCIYQLKLVTTQIFIPQFTMPQM